MNLLKCAAILQMRFQLDEHDKAEIYFVWCISLIVRHYVVEMANHSRA